MRSIFAKLSCATALILAAGMPVRAIGQDGFTEQVWWGLAAPAGTPDTMVRRLNAEFVRLFREAKFLDYMESQYLETVVGSPESFAKFMREDRERAGVVVRKYNVPRQ